MRVRMCPEFPGLVITDDGRIQGPGRPQGGHPTWLKTWPGTNGYLKFTATVNDRRTNQRVHIVVCTAFHGPRPTPRHDVRHLNGINTDNRAENLCWGTKTDNAADRDRHGHTARGSRGGNSKLTEDQVREIRAIRATGTTLQVIADQYGVDKSLISMICLNKIWRHVV